MLLGGGGNLATPWTACDTPRGNHCPQIRKRTRQINEVSLSTDSISDEVSLTTDSISDEVVRVQASRKGH